LKYENSDGKVKETQLFNLRDNPNELVQEHHAKEVIQLTGNTPTADQRDLAEDPKFAATRHEMETLLTAEMERLHDPYRFDEGYVNGKGEKKSKRKNRKETSVK
jgi:hypothetical protein